MRKTLTILCMVIAVILTACKAEPKYETETIMNKFTVTYPKDWNISKVKEGNITIYSGHLTTENVYFYRFDSGFEFEGLLETWRNKDNDDVITDIKFKTLKIDSHDAFYVEYVLKDYPDSKKRSIYILLNSRIYSISEISNKGGVDEKELEKIVSSISLKDSSVKIFEELEL